MLKINLTGPQKTRINGIFNNNQISFLIISTLYITIGILLIFYNPHTFNSDGVSYINIAHDYFNGNYGAAINEYWGPLISWILVPFIYFFGKTPSQSLFAAKILSLTIGLFTLIGFRLLIHRFDIDEKIGNILLLALIPEIIYFSFRWVNSDLLITTILTFYLAFLLSFKYPNKASFAVLCGLLGGLAYLAKSYGFAFFIVSFTVFNCIYFIKMRSKRTNIIKNAFLGFGIFLVVSGLWIGLMDSKYGNLSIGSSTQFNVDLTSSDSLKNAIEFNGLVDLPNKYAVSYWEDPSTFQPKIVQRTSLELIDHRLKITWDNIFIFLGIIESFSLLSIVIIVASIMCCYRTSDKKVKNDIASILLVLLIYSGGYILIFMEGRYLLLDCILILLLGGYLINALFCKYSMSSTIKGGLLILFTVSFILTPTISTHLDLNNAVVVYDLIPSLEKYGVHGNIASSNPEPENFDPQFIAYYLKGHYFGLTKKNESVKDLQIELKSKNIDYYLVWQYPYTENINLPYPEVTGGEIKFLKIYKIH
jgi:hypothetical protein